MKMPNNAIKFAPCGRRMLASSRRLWRRYASKILENKLSKEKDVIEYSKRLKLLKQREKVNKINSYLLNHPPIVAALLSGYVSLCGFVILWVVFFKEKINLVDYVSVGDLFFGIFAVDFAPLLILGIVSVLAWGYFRLLKVEWTNLNRFWLIVVSYLMVAPLFPALVWYQPISLCDSDNKIYSVTYKLPTMNVERDLVMVASLSNYKVFKRHAPGCNVDFDEYSDKDRDNDFQLVVIPDNAIAKMEVTHKKT